METYQFEEVDFVPCARIYKDGVKVNAYIVLTAENCEQLGLGKEFREWGKQLF